MTDGIGLVVSVRGRPLLVVVGLALTGIRAHYLAVGTKHYTSSLTMYKM
jgi:hypothetical protein